MKKFNMKTIMGIGAVAFATIVAAIGEISNQKREREFEDMKDRLAELESKQEEG